MQILEIADLREADAGLRTRKPAVLLQGVVKAGNGLLVAVGGLGLAQQLQAFQVVIEGLDILGRTQAFAQRIAFRGQHAQQGLDDFVGNPALRVEHIEQASIKGFTPHGETGAGVGKAGTDAQCIAFTTHTGFQHRCDAQLRAECLGIPRSFAHRRRDRRRHLEPGYR